MVNIIDFVFAEFAYRSSLVHRKLAPRVLSWSSLRSERNLGTNFVVRILERRRRGNRTWPP